MKSKEPGRGLKTLERAVDLIGILQDRNGARVTEVAEAMNLPSSTVHGYLATLAENRYLVKEGDTYHIGLRMLNVGGYAAVRKDEYRAVRTKVRQIALETGESVQFIAEEHGRGYYIHTDTEHPDIQIDARIGKEVYLHASAAGKAVLAHLPRERQDEIIDRWQLPRLTEHTITDREALFEEIESIREKGFSINREESVLGLHAIGVPVRTNQGEILGGLSIAGPASRLKGDELTSTLPELLLRAANEVELSILSPGPR